MYFENERVIRNADKKEQRHNTSKQETKHRNQLCCLKLRQKEVHDMLASIPPSEAALLILNVSICSLKNNFQKE